MELCPIAWSLLSLFLSIPTAASSEDANQDSVATTRLAPSRTTSKNTKFVSCFGKGHPTGSYIVRSPVLTSPGGLHRAYAEVAAIAFRAKEQPSDSEPSCENTSRLFLAGPGVKEFKLVYSQAPPDFSDGNSLKLVDWSPDGTKLLIERTIWAYESEGDFTDVVLFDVNSGRATAPDLPKLLGARFAKDCSSENSVMGFTADGNVVVSIAPVRDTYYNEGATSCVRRKTAVALNSKRELQTVASVLPAGFVPQRYGHHQTPH